MRSNRRERQIERGGEREIVYHPNCAVKNSIDDACLLGKVSRKKVTHQGLPSVSITPKSMTYRDTAYLKNMKDT